MVAAFCVSNLNIISHLYSHSNSVVLKTRNHKKWHMINNNTHTHTITTFGETTQKKTSCATGQNQTCSNQVITWDIFVLFLGVFSVPPEKKVQKIYFVGDQNEYIFEEALISSHNVRIYAWGVPVLSFPKISFLPGILLII